MPTIKEPAELAEKTLSEEKNHFKFGYILFTCTSSNPFFLDVVEGIASRAAELRESGVTVEIRYCTVDDPDLQVRHIDDLLKSGIVGLALTPINHPTVVDRIRALTEEGFPVVTANSDLPGSGRLAYVGSDYFKGGETAAGLINLFCAGRVCAGIVTGSPLVLCHSERIEGFMSRIEKAYPDITVAGTEACYDDDLESYNVTKRLLKKYPAINALYVVAGGAIGSCRAIEELGLTGRIKLISNDAAAEYDLINSGAITATITQEPFVQGSKPLDILTDYVNKGIKPANQIFNTAIDIKILENL